MIDGKVFEAFKDYTKKTRKLIRKLAKSVTDYYQILSIPRQNIVSIPKALPSIS